MTRTEIRQSKSGRISCSQPAILKASSTTSSTPARRSTQGRQKLEDLKADMATEGIQSLMPRANGDATATETQVKYAESTSDLQRMAFALKDSLEKRLKAHGGMGGITRRREQ